MLAKGARGGLRSLPDLSAPGAANPPRLGRLGIAMETKPLPEFPHSLIVPIEGAAR